MKQFIRFGVLSAAIVLSIVGNSIPVAAVGEQIKQLTIAEVSPESAQSAGEEYVELFNPNTDTVNVTGWQLQYRSYSHNNDDTGSWTTRAILGCASNKASDCVTLTTVDMGAGDTLRLSSYETGDGVLPLESGMSTTGGELRLIQPGAAQQAAIVQDMVGYGAAKGFEGTGSAPAPKAGRSIVRALDDKGVFVDTNQNAVDFTLQPDDAATVPQSPAGTTPEGEDGQSPITDESNYLDAEITELLPDPASPKLDSADEFIEIYNPYGETLNLTGYVLKTGTNWSRQFVIGGTTIDPYGYAALMSAQTHLSLSNAGGGVRLYDPNGKLLFEVPSYGTAKSGDSWARNAQGQWVWTTTPTAGGANIIDVPVATQTTKASTASAAKKSTAKATSTKKTTTPKSTAAVKGAATTAPQSSASATNNQTGLWVMAGAGVLGTGYALFEYRQDIRDFVRRRWQVIGSFGRSK